MADSFVADVKDSFTPDAKPAPKAKMGPSQGGDDPRAISAALLDTLGLSGRAGSVPLAGDKTTKTPLGVVLKPDNAMEVATREAVTAPLTAASLPVRIGAQAGLGALERLTSGHGMTDAGYAALLDATVAGITEGALGYVGGKVAKVAAPLRAFRWATEAPGKALEFLRSRLPKGQWMNVPSISGAKMTADEAVDELVKLTGAEYEVARKEIASEFSRLDKQRITGPKPVAGTVFTSQTSPERFEPSHPGMRAVADRVAQGFASPVTRAAADTATSIPADDMTGASYGGLGVLAAKDRLGDIARRWILHR